MAKSKAKSKKKDAAAESAPSDPGVASEEANMELVHTDDLRDQAEAGAAAPEVPEGVSKTTRHDATDLGVPMLPGSPDEPVGPEDALGEGPKRGDYRKRIVGSSHEGGVPQNPRAEDIGDAEGLKGGVETGS
jgi:hypothetical protein